MNSKEFRKHAHQFVDWMADYYENIESYPVKSQVKPGDIYNQIPENAPQDSESIPDIFKDFEDIIMPGMTHWQHPHFHAYFNGNASFPSILAEMLTSTLGAQCMIWDTSPAAAELEEKMMNWLREMIGLPNFFHGVIQDTASTATLVAFLTAREQSTNYEINQKGFSGNENFRIYCSKEAHSSIDKGVKIAGFGLENLVHIPTDQNLALKPEALETAIKNDLEAGRKPTCVVAAIGTTGTTAIDPLEEIARICQKYKIWLHVDAAYFGSALVLPENRWMIKGIEMADSFVFNPHKWMFTNFDCSAYYVKDKEALLKTFEILPEYLKTKSRGQVNDYRDWGIQLGRRFRALKLWFVIRNFGVQGIKEKIKLHIDLTQEFARRLEKHPDFEILVPVHLNLVCFRFKPQQITNEKEINDINEKLLQLANDTGNVFLTHTKIGGQYALRMLFGQTYVEKRHMENVWELLLKLIKQL
nr:aminotransferase class I/II-fold pyridoxal phosphate-dependent enzyme [Flexithrix dorotheae]